MMFVMAHRFYHAGPLAVGLVTLDGPEAHHVAHVVRRQAGEQVVLFNGDGNEYLTRLEVISKSRVEAIVVESRRVDREAARQVTITCPLPKGDRAQFLVEKLTELGVARYLPLRTARSVVHPGEGKTDKLRRYVIEASKQCGRNVLMQVDAITTWQDLVGRADLPASRCLGDAAGETLTARPEGACIIALGPEGGWEVDELRFGTEHGWRLMSLGKSILRIETAALTAAALCLHLP